MITASLISCSKKDTNAATSRTQISGSFNCSKNAAPGLFFFSCSSSFAPSAASLFAASVSVSPVSRFVSTILLHFSVTRFLSSGNCPSFFSTKKHPSLCLYDFYMYRMHREGCIMTGNSAPYHPADLTISLYSVKSKFHVQIIDSEYRKCFITRS